MYSTWIAAEQEWNIFLQIITYHVNFCVQSEPFDFLPISDMVF